MSTTKIIKGLVRQWEEPIGVTNATFVAGTSEVRQSLNWQPATLYIGPGKVWTEDEVRAMLEPIKALVKHGLTL